MSSRTSNTTSANNTVLTHRRYNKYAQITARAVRQSLQETERLGAEKRGLTALRYQKWEDGVGGQQVSPTHLAVFHCSSTALQVYLNPEQDKAAGKQAA